MVLLHDLCLHIALSVLFTYHHLFQGGFSGLHLAAQEGYKGIVKMLLDAGASEKIVNNVSSFLADIYDNKTI